MEFLLTCNAWLESIAKKEIITAWWEIKEVKDRLVFFTWNDDLIAKINLWSRVWNKLYIVLNSKKNVDNFDKLYDLVSAIDWKKYIQTNFPIVTKATSLKSLINSTPAIQKIAKKAIVDKLTNKSWALVREDSSLPAMEIFTFFIEDEAFVLWNTTWETLHKRWYRDDTWEAPIKETLAAGLVLLSNWNFSKPLLDFCCWSWTIAIEAVMIAKNIAPGLTRFFAFEKWDFIDKNLMKNEIELAKSKIFDKKYNITASDINPEMIEIAKQNAKNAWVLDDINFQVKDLKEYRKETLEGSIISNPPYWIRLQQDDLDVLYKNIAIIFDKNPTLNGWIITSYQDFQKYIPKNKFKNRKLYNWNELCYFYQKISTFNK